MRVPALMRPGLPLESSLNVFLMSGSPLKRRAKSEFELSENSDESSTPRVFLSSIANEVNCKLQSTQRNILMRGRISLISRNPHRAPLSFGIGRPDEEVVRCAKLAEA